MMVYFEIHADDCARAAEFYHRVFGWHAERDANLPIEYWRVEKGAILKRAAPAPARSMAANAFVVSFEVEDFDATAQRVTSAGGSVALAKFAVEGKCWQGYFHDTEGNLFGLFEVM